MRGVHESPGLRVIRELRDSLPTSPVGRMQSQSTYCEIIPIVPSHVSTN
jgi:hypothetical protein